jgi:hypothetical protein
MAGLKTIIALSFVRSHNPPDLKDSILTYHIGPSYRISSCHPLLGAVEELPPPPRSSDLRNRTPSKLALRPRSQQR